MVEKTSVRKWSLKELHDLILSYAKDQCQHIGDVREINSCFEISNRDAEVIHYFLEYAKYADPELDGFACVEKESWMDEIPKLDMLEEVV